MLDKNSQKLLKFINKETQSNSYKVIDKSDFLKSFKKKKNKVNVNTLSSMLSYMEKQEFISIKYSDEQVYCLTSTKKGRNYFDNEITLAKEAQKLKRIFLFYTVLAGLAAFGGTLIALYIFFY